VIGVGGRGSFQMCYSVNACEFADSLDAALGTFLPGDGAVGMRILCLVFLFAWSMFEGQYDIGISDVRGVSNICHITLFLLKLES